MTAELSTNNQLTTDEMTVDTDASHTSPRHSTLRGVETTPATATAIWDAQPTRSDFTR